MWEDKSKEYLEKITSDAGSSDYKKIRAGSSTIGTSGGSIGSAGGDLVGKEEELSKVFKNIAQKEDLIDFFLYLTTANLENRYSVFNDTYNDKLPEELNDISYTGTSDGAYKAERKGFSMGTKSTFSNKDRDKMKSILDDGGSIVLSIRHKGSGNKSHIILVQSITSEGIVVDDPFGGHAQDYKYGETGDLFAGKDKAYADRKDANFRNKVFDKVTETDYSKRDFTAEAAQNLEADESRGKSQLIKWEMINESKGNFIKYIVFYSNN